MEKYKVWYLHYSAKKPICNSCKGYQFYKPMSNADKIRNMSDEELAYFLDDISHRDCSQICIGQCEQIQCEDGILKYLKSKVKGSE